MMLCFQINCDVDEQGSWIEFLCDAEDISAIIDIELFALTSRATDITLPPVKISLVGRDDTQQDTLQHVDIEQRTVTLKGELHTIECNCTEVPEAAWQGFLEALCDMCAQRTLTVGYDGQDLSLYLAAIEAAKAKRHARWQALKQSCSEAVTRVLLCKDEPQYRVAWPDYLAYGLTRDDIPALIEIVERFTPTDDTLPDEEYFGSVHALRALARLQDPDTLPIVMALSQQADEQDWIFGELPGVLECFGEAAIPAIQAGIRDKTLNCFVRSLMAETLTTLSADDAEKQAATVSCIVEALQEFQTNDPAFNGLMISELINLRALEHIPLISTMYAEDKVDWSVNGDWDDVQIELGLLEQRLTPKPNYNHWGKTPEQIAKIELFEKQMAEMDAIKKQQHAKEKQLQQKRKQQIKQQKKARKKRR